MKSLTRSLMACMIALAGIVGCSEKTDSETAGGNAALSGHLYWVSSADIEIHKLDLATGKDVVLGDGHGVDKAPDGKLIIIGKSGIEESDEQLLSSKVIKKSNVDSTDDAEVNQRFPKVSPDGKLIAYQTLGDNSYVCERNGGDIVARFEQDGATDGFLNPNWTPDGRLVMAGGFANPGLYVTDADVKTTRRFDPDLDQPKQPAVSPDGTKVAFILKDLVFVIGLDGEGLTQVDPTTDSVEDRFPTWSPDGKYIAHFSDAGRVIIRPAAGGEGIDLFDVYPDLHDKLLVMSSTVPMQWTE